MKRFQMFLEIFVLRIRNLPSKKTDLHTIMSQLARELMMKQSRAKFKLVRSINLENITLQSLKESLRFTSSQETENTFSTSCLRWI